MEKLIIRGGKPLNGTIKISGAKNAVLTIIPAVLLGETPSVLEEVANLCDVNTISDVIRHLGAPVHFDVERETLTIDSSKISSLEAPYELVRKMRASNLILGPLLARFGRCRIALPGGCAIGSRPMDLHLKGFEALGAKITVDHGTIEAVAPNGLTGSNIYLDFPSVGATENIMMAASLATGITTIENAAKEPEIVDLANCLNTMGAKVRGAGTTVIKIEGVAKLHGTNHTIIPDRIEAGTYMIAAAITRGQLRLENVLCEHLVPVIAKLREAGVKIEEDVFGVTVTGADNYRAVDVTTLPYPGFPTDMQAQFMALMTLAEGKSCITETVFENRFMHVDEFKRMGANVHIEGHSAYITGVKELTGCSVKATDLRAGAAMILAGLAANGETSVGNIHHIDRGYDRLVSKLRNVGAQISREHFAD